MFHAMIQCEYLAIINTHLQSYFTLVRGFHCIAVKVPVHPSPVDRKWLVLVLKISQCCNIYWAPPMYRVLSTCFTFTISSALGTTHCWGRHHYFAQGNDGQRGRSYNAGGHQVSKQQSRDSKPTLSDSKACTSTLPSCFFNWMITALQSRVGFCRSTMQISCECMYVCVLYIYIHTHTYISTYISSLWSIMLSCVNISGFSSYYYILRESSKK